MSKQKRMPITYPEIEAFHSTGEFPLMDEPIKPGKTPYCENCRFWEHTDPFSGQCNNKDAISHVLFGDEKLGSASGLITGRSCSCPEHQFKTPNNHE